MNRILKSHIWNLRMPAAILALGMLSAFFIYLINRNIEFTHQHTIRADILMDATNRVSSVHLGVFHQIKGYEPADRGNIEAELSETEGKLRILLEGGVCQAGCTLPPLEDKGQRLKAQAIIAHMADFREYIATLLEKATEDRADIPTERVDHAYAAFIRDIGDLEDRIEAELAQSDHRKKSLMRQIALSWLAVISVSVFWFFVYELRGIKAREALRRGEEKYRGLFDSATDGIFILDQKGNFMDANPTAYQRLGYSREELLSMHISELDHPDFAAGVPERMRQIREHGVAVFESAHMRKDGTVMPVEVNARLLDYEGGKAYLSIIRDITERKEAEGRMKAALEQKDALLREVHHRVKNNLQIMTSLLKLQARFVGDEKTAGHLSDSQSRIRAMALVHEKLYLSSDLANIDFRWYIESLAANLSGFMGSLSKGVEVKMDIEDAKMNADTAVPCGLIINELLTNCYKYAFPEGRGGEIRVSLGKDDTGEYLLRVSDNGVGLPAEVDIKNPKTLGLELVVTLAEKQLRGRVEVETGNGTEFRVAFREIRYNNRL